MVNNLQSAIIDNLADKVWFSLCIKLVKYKYRYCFTKRNGKTFIVYFFNIEMRFKIDYIKLYIKNLSLVNFIRLSLCFNTKCYTNVVIVNMVTN